MIAVGCKSEGGKSELRRAVRRVTPGQGNLKESGTENIPPPVAGWAERHGERRWVRVKRCGKSAPRRWQHRWQAKPRTEQDQIGKWRPDRRSIRRRVAQTARLQGFRVGRSSPSAMKGLEE